MFFFHTQTNTTCFPSAFLQDNIKACLSYLRKAIALRWFRYDEMTERLHFRYVRRSEAESYAEGWQSLANVKPAAALKDIDQQEDEKKERVLPLQDKDQGAKVPGAEEPAQEEPAKEEPGKEEPAKEPPKEEPGSQPQPGSRASTGAGPQPGTPLTAGSDAGKKGKAKSTGRGGARGGGGRGRGAAPPKPTQPTDDQAYLRATSAAAGELAAMIACDPLFEWAKNMKDTELLRSNLDELERTMRSDHEILRYLSSGSKARGGKHEAEHGTPHGPQVLAKVAQAMQVAQEVERITNRLHNMQRARALA